MDLETAKQIVGLALNGDKRYSWEIITIDDENIFSASAQVGGTPFELDINNRDIACYDCGNRWALLTDNNDRQILVWVNK
jgi:hypothetical protein